MKPRTAQALRNAAVSVPLQPAEVKKAVMSPPGDITALKYSMTVALLVMTAGWEK